MWKYGYLLTENKQSRTQFIELKASFMFDVHHLFRMMGHTGGMTLYFLQPDGHREVISTMSVENHTWFGHDRVMLDPGVKLVMAFHGVKRKENAMLAEHVTLQVHGHDEQLKMTHTNERIVRSVSLQPVDVFRHKFRPKGAVHADRDRQA
jgi:hypothetical protein